MALSLNRKNNAVYTSGNTFLAQPSHNTIILCDDRLYRKNKGELDMLAAKYDSTIVIKKGKR